MTIIEQISESTDWERYERRELSFPADSVVEAYQRGKEVGAEDTYKEIGQTITTQLNQIAKDIEVIEEELSKLNIQISGVKLRINNIDNYDVLILIPEDKYTSPDFLPAFKISSDIANSRKFTLTISFVNDTGNIDAAEIAIDGYTLSRASK